VTANNILNNYYKAAATVKNSNQSVVWMSLDLPSNFFYVYNVFPIIPQYISAIQAMRGAEFKLFDVMEGKWDMPRDMCSEIKAMLGEVVLDRNYANRFLPKPDFLCSANNSCTQIPKGFEFLGNYLQLPNYYIDIPADYVAKSPEQYCTYVAAQLKHLGQTIESKGYGKYDAEKFRRYILYFSKIVLIWNEICKLCKISPSPVDAQDLNIFGPSLLLNDLSRNGEKILTLYISLYNELYVRMQEDIRQKRPPEKKRILWYSLGIYKYRNFIKNLLSKFGASITFMTTNYTGPMHNLWDDLQFNFPLTAEKIDDYFCSHIEESAPFGFDSFKALNSLDIHEYFAKIYMIFSLRKSLLYEQKRVKELIEIFNIDAVIMHMNQNCRVLSLSQANIVEYLHNTLGIPTLVIHADSMDDRHFSIGQMSTRIEAFLEGLES
jgi:benzoyl-CoA reductase/2-hydroxyglutaryl-CoA dehydratase subunit BcrC/BadD/HgdB